MSRASMLRRHFPRALVPIAAPLWIGIALANCSSPSSKTPLVSRRVTAPPGGGAAALAYNGQTLVAINEHGTVLTSTDAANTWHHVGAFPADRRGAIRSAFALGRRVCFEQQFGGLRRISCSDDEGVSWTNLTTPNGLRAVVVAGGRAVALTSTLVVASNTRGEVWNDTLLRRNARLATDWFGVIAAEGNSIYVGGWLDGQWSSDGGRSWSPAPGFPARPLPRVGPTRPPIRISPAIAMTDSGAVLVFSGGGPAYRLARGDTKWTQIGQVPPLLGRATPRMKSAAGKLWIGMASSYPIFRDEARRRTATYRSDDRGRTWKIDSFESGEHLTITEIGKSLAVATDTGILIADAAQLRWEPGRGGLPSRVLAISHGGGKTFAWNRERVFRRVANGDWTRVIIPDSTGQILDLIADSTNVAILLDSGLFRAPVSGGTWSRLLPQPRLEANEFASIDAQLLVAGPRLLVIESGRFYVTADNGATWSDGWQGEERGEALAILGHAGPTVFVHADSGVFATDDWKTWRAVETEHPSLGGIVASATGRRIVAGTDRGAVEVLTLDGSKTTWDTRSGNGIGHEEITTIWADPDADQVILAGTERGLFWSTDGGNHFTQVQGAPELTKVRALARRDSTFTVVTDLGVIDVIDRIERISPLHRAARSGVEYFKKHHTDPLFIAMWSVASMIGAYVLGVAALLLLAWRRGSRIFGRSRLAGWSVKPLTTIPGLTRWALFIGYHRRLERDPIIVRAAANYFGLPASDQNGKAVLPGLDGAELHKLILSGLGAGRPVRLVGKGGAGKTTVLARIAWLASRQKLSADLNGYRPVYVRASSFANSLEASVADSLERQYGVEFPKGTVEDQLRSGKFLILFDGASEIETDDRARVLDQLVEEACASRLHNWRVIFASRPLDGIASSASTVELRPITAEAISVLADQYKLPAAARIRLTQLLEGFGDRAIEPLMFELARTYATENVDDDGQRATRSLLYQAYCKGLLRLRDGGDGVKWAGWELLLSHIAQWSLLDAGRRGVGIDHESLLTALETPPNKDALSMVERLKRHHRIELKGGTDALAFVTALNAAGLLRGGPPFKWRFAHDTFEEFFAATRLFHLAVDGADWPTAEWSANPERILEFVPVLEFLSEMIAEREVEPPINLDRYLGDLNFPQAWAAVLVESTASV